MSMKHPQVDRHRAAVYQAEDVLSAVMSRADRRVMCQGRVLSLPEQYHFADVASMQRFVDLVLSDTRLRAHHGDMPGVRVQPGRGFRRATYREGRINIPVADRRGRWAMTGTVLLHELAHHIAGVQDGHGGQFRAALVLMHECFLGSDAASLLRSLFEPLERIPEASPPPQGGAFGRVALLLAKAQGTSNESEADAYLAKATLLAQKHSIDLAVTAMGGTNVSGLTHRMVSVGEPGRTQNRALVRLLAVIGHAWGVRIDVGPASCYAILYGMPADLDRVESVFFAAATMMLTRSEEHVRSREWDGTAYLAGSGEARPVTAGVARSAFFTGFTGRLASRLRDDAATASREAQAEVTERARQGREATVALALRARDVQVTDYYRQNTSAKGTMRASSARAGTASASRRAGERAADEFGRADLTASTRQQLEGSA